MYIPCTYHVRIFPLDVVIAIQQTGATGVYHVTCYRRLDRRKIWVCEESWLSTTILHRITLYFACCTLRLAGLDLNCSHIHHSGQKFCRIGYGRSHIPASTGVAHADLYHLRSHCAPGVVQFMLRAVLSPLAGAPGAAVAPSATLYNAPSYSLQHNHQSMGAKVWAVWTLMLRLTGVSD